MEALEFSRPAAVAALLGSETTQRFTQKRVLLCGEPDLLLRPNGCETFRAAFLLLIRICERVALSLPDECAGLRHDIETLAAQYVPSRQPIWENSDVEFHDFDAILSVGTAARADLPWTVINSDGWIVRLSSCGTALPAPKGQVNAIAAVAAACLGVGEVFKRLIVLQPDRGELLEATSFSLWDHMVSAIDPGPSLSSFLVDTFLIGCGAIGSANAYLLSRLPASGRVYTLDRQCYQPENFGTSMIVGPNNYGSPKAEVVASFLRPKFDVKSFPMEIGDLQAEYDGRYPDVILAGLDEVEPRHEVQNLWPALIVDGAVGAELSCQVSCHPWSGETACLLCTFQKPQPKDLAEIYARATGLPAETANNPDAVITEELIASAREDRRTWLKEHLGKRMCSITAEAVVTFLSAEAHDKSFAPAVPFVSCFSACLCMTELIRHITTGAVAPAPRYQMNFLWGPRRGVSFEENRRVGCYCVERAKNISRLRSLRGR